MIMWTGSGRRWAASLAAPLLPASAGFLDLDEVPAPWEETKGN